MIKINLGPWAFLALGIISGANSLSADSISIGNSGFEVPSAPFTSDGCNTNSMPVASDYIYTPSGCGQAWTFENGSGITYSDNGGFFNPVSPDGSHQAAFLQGPSDFFQTISGFNIGDTIMLEFYAAMRQSGCGRACGQGQTVSVFLDNTQLTFSGLSSIQPGASYALYTTDEFVATADTYTLKFVGNGFTGEDTTAFIDEVSGTATTPEPASFGTIGAVAFAGLLWRKRLARR